MWGNARQQSTPARQINHTRIEDEREIEEIYELGKCLGKGSFGTVLHARHSADGNTWAIKAINKEKAGSAAVKLLEREVSIMKRVQHPDIIHLEEVYESSKKMFLVMELCDLGGLNELLREKGSFTEIETACIMRQIAEGIAYLHDNDIIHRDLKLDNILLSHPAKEEEPVNVKITDFGLSYIRGGMGSDYMMQQVCGTPMYMAPEVIDNLGYSQQCDIWSMGVIMFSLVTGAPPFVAPTEEKLYELIRKAEIDFSHASWVCYSQGARQLVEGMLKADPAHRYTSKEILNHPWVKGENCENGQVFNVLEMMKQYNLEQKMAKMSEKPAEDDQTSENIDMEIVAHEDINANVSISPPKNSTKGTRLPEPSKTTLTSKPSVGKLQSSRNTSGHSSPKVLSGNDNSKGSPVSKKGVRSNNIPSYMMPTKSSTAPRNPNRKDDKKK